MVGRDRSLLAAARAGPLVCFFLATELDEKSASWNYELSSNSN